jgi:anti-sigma factor RsiW
LAALARGRLDEKRAQSVREHVGTCATCRTSYQRIMAAQDAMGVVAQAPAPEPSPAAEARGEATVRWSRVRPERRVPWWLWGTFATSAAAAAVAIYLARAPHPVQATVVPPATAPVRVAPETQALEATLTLLGGNVDLVRGGRTGALTAAEKLRGGDALFTHADSRVAAQWSDGSGFLLLSDASLSLARLDRSTQRLRLSRGQVDVRVGAHQPGEVMTVESNAHRVTVRGTWFAVAAAGERTTVEVYEGVVEVTELDGSASTMLHAPARAVFGRGGRISSAPLEAHEMAQLRQRAELNLLPWADVRGSGTLVVDTTPSGTVAVDGVELGASPLVVRRPLGNHYVEVSRPKYKPLQKWVTIGAEPGELRVALLRSAVETVELPEAMPIEELVKLRQREIRSCYERSLKRDPSLTGTVSLQLRVGATGQVSQARVDSASSTLADQQVSTCLEHEASRWRLATVNATVVYPLVFRPE